MISESQKPWLRPQLGEQLETSGDLPKSILLRAERCLGVTRACGLQPEDTASVKRPDSLCFQKETSNGLVGLLWQQDAALA